MGPSSQGGESIFYPDALPCVRRCSWWVPAVRGASRFFARTYFLACEGVAGGSQQSGGKHFFLRNTVARPVGPSSQGEMCFSRNKVARPVGPRCQVEE